MVKVTISEVARHAGVSKTAVSYAFNEPSRISAATLHHIHAIAHELGYMRDPLAQMLSTRRIGSIGLLLPHSLHHVLANPYHIQLLRGIGHVCQREGRSLLLVPPLKGSICHALAAAASDGFIIPPIADIEAAIQILRARGAAIVLLDAEVHQGLDCVMVDDEAGAYALMEYVLEQGHCRIAIATWGDTCRQSIVARRLAGCMRAVERAMKVCGSLHVTTIQTTCSEQGGRKSLRLLWQRGERPTALIALGDSIAIGALLAARDLGLRVPQDLSVAGFDDLPAASWMQPALTTVHQPIETKGRLAAEVLLAACGDTPQRKRLTLPATLVVRQSVGPVAS